MPTTGVKDPEYKPAPRLGHSQSCAAGSNRPERIRQPWARVTPEIATTRRIHDPRADSITAFRKLYEKPAYLSAIRVRGRQSFRSSLVSSDWLSFVFTSSGTDTQLWLARPSLSDLIETRVQSLQP